MQCDLPSNGASTIAYLCFDLETTGFLPLRDYIIEIGAEILDQNGIPMEDGLFQTFIKSEKNVPNNIQLLTGITNAKLADAPEFDVALSSFLQFIQEKLSDSPSPITNICFVAHNGKRFDLPFLLKQIEKYKVTRWNGFCKRWEPLYIDTLLLARESVKSQKPKDIPNSYRLCGLNEYVTGDKL